MRYCGGAPSGYIGLGPEAWPPTPGPRDRVVDEEASWSDQRRFETTGALHVHGQLVRVQVVQLGRPPPGSGCRRRLVAAVALTRSASRACTPRGVHGPRPRFGAELAAVSDGRSRASAAGVEILRRARLEGFALIWSPGSAASPRTSTSACGDRAFAVPVPSLGVEVPTMSWLIRA